MNYTLDKKDNDMLYDATQHLIILKKYYKEKNDPVGARMVEELVRKMQYTFNIE